MCAHRCDEKMWITPERKGGRGSIYPNPHTACVSWTFWSLWRKKRRGGAVSKWCWRAERRHRAFEMSAAADFGASMPAFFSQIRAPWDPGEQRETCTVTPAAGMWTTSHTEAKDEPAPCLLILLGFFSPFFFFLHRCCINWMLREAAWWWCIGGVWVSLPPIWLFSSAM